MGRPRTYTPPPAASEQCMRLWAAREKLGLSQEGVARILGMTRHYWTHLENGRRPLRLDTLYRIAVGLGLDPHDLDPRLASTTTKPEGGDRP